MFDIVYIVSHGFAARMVMQTNLLGRLVIEGKKVALIAPDKEDKALVKYCAENGVKLFEFSSNSSFWNNQYLTARKYFLEDINANPALLEKHIRAIRFNKSKHPWKHLQPRLLYMAYKLVNYFPKLRKWYKQREERYLESDVALDLVEKIDSDIVVSTYPVSFQEAMLLKAAKSLKKKTVIHLLSWDNISCKGHFPVLVDEYIAWGPIMKAEFVEYYNIPEEAIHVCGVPHFDIHIDSRRQPSPQKYLEQLGLNPNFPYLFFGMSSPRFAPKEIDIVEWLADQIQKNLFGKNMQLIVRPHPQNVVGGMSDQSWLPRLRKLHRNKVAVDFPDLVDSKMRWSMQKQDMYRLSHLLAGAMVSLNSGSTLSIDALMCDTPVILTSFDGAEKLPYWNSARRLVDYKHLKKLVSLGGVSVVRSYEDMEKEILDYLNSEDYKKIARKHTIREECWTEKYATDNVIHFFTKKNNSRKESQKGIKSFR